ncbi:MAG: signal peptidase I [Armatimonadota bacterium]
MEQWSFLPVAYGCLACVFIALLGLRIALAVRRDRAWVAERRAVLQDADGVPVPPGIDGAGTPASAQRKTPALTGLTIVLFVLFAALIIGFPTLLKSYYKTYYIPSAGMDPTLREGAKVFADMRIYHSRLPYRGEVVIFSPPDAAITGNMPEIWQREWLKQNPKGLKSLMGNYAPDQQAMLAKLDKIQFAKQEFIKRAIGLPGDHIRIVAGKGIYINGALLDEPYLPAKQPSAVMNFPVPQREPGKPPTLASLGLKPGALVNPELIREYESVFVEWLRDWYSYHYLYQVRIQPYLDGNVFVVPADSVFVMGDNRSRNGSFDSRYWGVVPHRSLRGRAMTIFWPPGQRGPIK